MGVLPSLAKHEQAPQGPGPGTRISEGRGISTQTCEMASSSGSVRQFDRFLAADTQVVAVMFLARQLKSS